MTVPTFTNLGASANPDFQSSADATSYANSSWTPPTSGLILLAVYSRNAAGPNEPTISGNGLTWEAIETVLASTVHRVTLFGADASGSSAGATTVDFAGQTQIGTIFEFAHVADADLSGGVAAAFVQAVNNTGTNVDTLAITLAAGSHVDNRPFAVFFHAANESKTERTDWTELDDLGGVAPTRNLQTQYRDDAFETTASATWASFVFALGIAVEIKGAGASGITEDVNQSSETDTAQAIAKSKAKAIAQNAETDSALVLSPARAYALAQNAETDAAQAFTTSKAKAIGQNVETDSAQPIARQRVYPLAQIEETDEAQVITAAKIAALNQAEETDEAQAFALAKYRLITQVEETDAALSISVGDSGELIVNLEQASETDAAQPITAQHARAVAQNEETDAAQAFTRIKIVTVSQVSETDLAQSLFPQRAVAVVQVEEIDLPQAFTAAKHKAIGQASETDSAQAIISVGPIIVVVGQATETDSALSIALFVAEPVAHYIYTIPAESRVYLIPADAEETIADRTFTIPAESRIYQVPHD